MSSLSSLWPILYEVEAICDYSSGHPQDLVFERGDSIVIRGVESDDWFNGTNLRSLRFGSFPKSKIRIIQQYEQQKKSRSVSATVENVSTTPPPLPSRNSTTPLPLPPRSVASARLADESPPTSVIGRLENHRRQVETVNLTGVLRVLLKEYDFREADERARSCPRHYERDCHTLSNYLVEPFRSANGILMARVIFSWICFNIEYDVESFFSGRRKDQSAASVLTSKQSVCQGYAQLYCELARFAGMKVLLISGVGKGFGFQNNMAADGTASMTQQQRSQLSHAWNAIEIHGEMRLIESTWGAGYICNQQFNRSFQDGYFLVSPCDFILSHLPTNSNEQFLPSPLISEKDWLMLPNTSNGYYKCNTRIKRCQLIQPGSYNMVRECTNLGVIQVANGLSIDLELELDLDYSPGKDLEQTLGEVLISKLLYDGVGGALTCLSYNTLSADKLRLTHRCILNPMYRGPATLEIYRNTTRVPELGMQTLFLKFKINNTDSNAPTPPTQPFPQNCFCTVFSYYSPSQEHPLKAGTRQTFHLQVYSLKHQQYKSLVVWMPDNSNVPFRQIAPGEFVAESVRLVGKGQLGIGDLVKKSDGSTSISFLMTYNVE